MVHGIPSTRRRLRSRGGLAFLALLFALASPQGPDDLHGQEVDFQWDLEEGESLVYRMVQEGQSTLGAMGDVTQRQELTMRQDVLGVGADGQLDLRVSYESLRHEQDGPMGSETFDSQVDDPPEGGELAVVAGLVGRSFELTIAPWGEVLTVQGMDGFVNEMAEELARTTPGIDSPQEARGFLEMAVGDEAMAALMEQGIQSLPQDPISVGDTWTQAVEVPTAFGNVASEYRYELEEVTEEDGTRIARVRMDGTMDGLVTDESVEGPLGQAADLMEGSEGELSGSFVFDLDRGRMLHSFVESSMVTEAAGQTIDVQNEFLTELLEGS